MESKEDIGISKWCIVAPVECSCKNGQCKNRGNYSKKEKQEFKIK